MTARIIRIFLVLLGVLALGLTLPDLYRKVMEKRPEKKWLYYSEISHEFIITEEVSDTISEQNGMIYYSPEGKQFTEAEYMQLLPFLYTRKLALMEALPDSINGLPFNRELQQSVKRGMLLAGGLFTYQLNPLFESKSGLVRPVLPDDLFRINSRGLEFIDPETNRIDQEKSRRFTTVLQSHGFQFPAGEIYGIPSVLKSRDDGYFITDREGDLYHLLMAKGEAVCRKIETAIAISHIKCTVPGDIYAYIYDTDRQLYVLFPDYTIKKLPMIPSNGRYMYSHNQFYKTFKNTDTDSTRMYVLDSNYDLVDYYAMEADHYSKSKEAFIESHLFPFRIMITPGYAHLIPLPNPFRRFIWLNLALTGILLAIKAGKRRKLGNIFNLIDLLSVLIFGIFGFISVLVFPHRK